MSVNAAADWLAERDPLIAALLARHGYPRLSRESFDPGRSGAAPEAGAPDADTFAFLVETVVYQQLSGNSARAIFSRLSTAFELIPKVFDAADSADLLAAGLSRSKATTLKRLARAVMEGSIDLSALNSMPDAEVRSVVSALPGFGPWSASMVLIFHLHRLDIWPVEDLAFKRSACRLLNLGTGAERDEVEASGSRFEPYRTVAAWLFWADDAFTSG